VEETRIVMMRKAEKKIDSRKDAAVNPNQDKRVPPSG
jgi:hypothetical protein